MPITKNRHISKEKEIFMAICLRAGVISYQTVRRMKKDWGVVKVKNGIIQTLIADGYIKKVESYSDDYGYQYGYYLTAEGLEYLRIKFPNKYNYDLFVKSEAYKYKAKIKNRGFQSSMILYSLYKMGISLNDHTREASNIINGYEEEVREPFFVTSKELKLINIRFKAIYGDRAYGFVFSSSKVFIVYAPDKDHNLLLSRERRITDAVTNILQYAHPPYNNPKNYEMLYFYNTMEDVVDSFSLGNKINKSQAATRRVYEEFKYKNSHIVFMDNNPYTIWDILDRDYKSEIDSIFAEAFRLESYHIKDLNAIYINSIRITDDGREEPTVICWDLSPSAIVTTIKYCIELYKEEYKKNAFKENQRNNKILFLCFRNQEPVLESIFGLNPQTRKHMVIESLTSKSVYDYLEGKTEQIV